MHLLDSCCVFALALGVLYFSPSLASATKEVSLAAYSLSYDDADKFTEPSGAYIYDTPAADDVPLASLEYTNVNIDLPRISSDFGVIGSLAEEMKK